MNELKHHITKAKKSLYFSGARISDELGAFLKQHSTACVALGQELRGKVDQIVLIGSGGSWATLQSAKYILDAAMPIPVECYQSFDLIWRNPARINSRTLAVLATYSGETDDVLQALKFVKKRGAQTLGIVGRPGSTVATQTDQAWVYNTGAIFEIPVAALALFAKGFASGKVIEGICDELAALPGLLKSAFKGLDARAEAEARHFLSANHMYVLGAGVLSPLAYKVALTVVMENIRIGGTYCDAAEFRHGPAEGMQRLKPDMMFLLGSDASRKTTLHSLKFAQKQGARVLLYDAGEFARTHPLLTPLVLNSVTQYFTVYSAILRGITDLDERVFMGHNVLASRGAKWP